MLCVECREEIREGEVCYEDYDVWLEHPLCLDCYAPRVGLAPRPGGRGERRAAADARTRGGTVLRVVGR